MKTEYKLKVIRTYGEHHFAFRGDYKGSGGISSYIKSITNPGMISYLQSYGKDKNESIDYCYINLRDRMWNCICED